MAVIRYHGIEVSQAHPRSPNNQDHSPSPLPCRSRASPRRDADSLRGNPKTAAGPGAAGNEVLVRLAVWSNELDAGSPTATVKAVRSDWTRYLT